MKKIKLSPKYQKIIDTFEKTKGHIKIHLQNAYDHLHCEDLEQVEFDIFEIGEILGIKATEINRIPTYTVTCVCNTEVEVEEHSIGECPNCGRGIDDRGIMQ